MLYPYTGLSSSIRNPDVGTRVDECEGKRIGRRSLAPPGAVVGLCLLRIGLTLCGRVEDGERMADALIGLEPEPVGVGVDSSVSVVSVAEDDPLLVLPVSSD